MKIFENFRKFDSLEQLALKIFLDLGGDQPEFLNYAKIPIMSKKDCQSKHTNEKDYESISDDMICAGFDHGGTDACNGDSGGPLMCTREDNTGLNSEIFLEKMYFLSKISSKTHF